MEMVKDVMITQEETTQECRLQDAVEEVKDLLKNEMALLQGTAEEVKVMKEKDIHLQKAQEEAA